MAKEERYPMGVSAFDNMIEGGFLPGHKVIVLGAPGTAKSTFCAQFLYNGVTKYDDHSIYVSTQEKKEDFYKNMARFGMDFQKLEDEKKFLYIEQGLVKKEFYDIVKVLGEIHKVNAKRIVFDSLNFFDVKYPDKGVRDIEMLSYMRALSGKGRISLWVSENYKPDVLEYQSSHFLSDGIIYLQHIPMQRGPYSRTINVLKLRGIKHDDKRHPFILGSDGLAIKKI